MVQTKRNGKLKKVLKYWPFYVMALPGLVYLFINNYIPCLLYTSAIPLEEGENTIEISFLPAGMKLGAAAALLGVVLLWLLLLGARRGWLYQPWLQRGSLWAFGIAGAAAFGMLYLFPMAVYLLV